MKNGLRGIAAMARSTNRSAEDGEPRVSAPTERGEPRDLSEPRDMSLEEVLKSYEQPINEEQAWAVCYQCCRGLSLPRPPAGALRRVTDPSSILLHRDGTVSVLEETPHDGRTAERLSPRTHTKLLYSNGNICPGDLAVRAEFIRGIDSILGFRS